MRITTARASGVAALVVTLGAGLVGAVAQWGADAERPAHTVPYEDPRSGGLLTLCSADGDPVTGGRVQDRPFAAVALGESALPAELDPAGAVGTLFAHQPREGVGAEEFSGAPITAAAVLADPGLPAVPVTSQAWSVGDFVAAFPADHDGHLQLRLVLGTPATGTLAEASYDTADLRVDGDRWELVRGGSASCADTGSRSDAELP